MMYKGLLFLHIQFIFGLVSGLRTSTRDHRRVLSRSTEWGVWRGTETFSSRTMFGSSNASSLKTQMAKVPKSPFGSICKANIFKTKFQGLFLVLMRSQTRPESIFFGWCRRRTNFDFLHPLQSFRGKWRINFESRLGAESQNARLRNMLFIGQCCGASKIYISSRVHIY